jgi:hypothetical protein
LKTVYFPPKIKREEEKENEVAKPVLNPFFRIYLKFTFKEDF